MGTSPSVLKNTKIAEIKPPVNTNVQTNIEILVNTESEQVNVVHDTNIKDNNAPDTNL